MIDGSEKRNRQLAFDRIRMFVKSAVKTKQQYKEECGNENYFLRSKLFSSAVSAWAKL